MLDRHGVHFDSSTPSTIERFLARDPLDDASLLTRARDGIARLQALDLSKYNLHDSSPAPDPGYVLVIDQTRGDAAITYAGASAARFAELLVLAQTEHPNARIVLKTHPETQSGLRPGHYDQTHAQGRITLCTTPVSPWRLLAGAIAVYTVSSQLGFEAILAGHRPVVLGQPFYMGWGLTDDRTPLPLNPL
jgi:capsular polysaccharide export protein